MLWHLRLRGKNGVLWVDAICIDQGNIGERNTQVRWMKDIYEGASEIIAWLGPEGDNGLLALSKIADIYQHYWMEYDRLGSPEAAFQSMLNNTTWARRKNRANAASSSKQHHRLHLADPGLSVLDDLSNRTWFCRVWIVQEVSSATTRHYVQGGSNH